MTKRIEKKQITAVINIVLRSLIAAASLFMVGWYIDSGMMNIGTVLGIIFFLLTGLCAVFFNRITALLKRLRKKMWMRIICDIIIFLVLAVIVWSSVLICCMAGYANRKPAENATVVVLGCQVNGEGPSLMLNRRIEAARDYLEKHPDSVCIVSGGKGSNELISEAECMYRCLTERGISPDRIFKEDQSVNTEENIRFSKAIIEKHDLNSNIAIVTDGFHEMRAAIIAGKQEVSCGAVPAETPFFLLASFATREIIALTAEIIFG